MEAKELVEKAMKRWESLDMRPLLPALRFLNDGALDDVMNVNGCRYYQWSTALVDEIKPKQVVELGGAMGVWSLCVLHTLPQDSKLYSVTLAEHGLEFSYVQDSYKNFVPVVGDDLDLSVWPVGLDLTQTDLWFFDSLHTPEQLTKEFELYSPFFKSGAVILIDDIRSFGLWPVWQRLVNGDFGKMSCYEATNPLHYTGYGVCVYE